MSYIFALVDVFTRSSFGPVFKIFIFFDSGSCLYDMWEP